MRIHDTKFQKRIENQPDTVPGFMIMRGASTVQNKNYLT